MGCRFLNWGILALDGTARTGRRLELNLDSDSRVELDLHDEPN